MKKILTILLATASAALAQTSTAVNDQIAIQLGAIQMGYTTPFVLTASSNATVNQQACNALVQGRKAMTARASSPGVNVQAAVNVPAVDSVEFRDQLYQAVENVVTTPLKATVSGVATLVGGKRIPARAYLNPPPNSWMVPVPFALEARQAVECNNCDELRAELVSNGVLVPPNMVLVNGGTLPQGSELAGQQVETFQIGKYEVTWDEWQSVRDWAVNNGYGDLAHIGEGSAGNHPVRNLNWYDVVKWCNAKSEKEGLTPVYQVAGGTFTTGHYEPTVNSAANGYRLPLEKEWEWAARGGVASQGYTYSGSNELNEVCWYRDNSSGAVVDLGSIGWWDNPAIGGGTWPVGQKGANELGIFDMSGNVSEWCWDKGNEEGSQRHFRGPSWYNYAYECPVIVRVSFGDPMARISVTGFRLARSSGQ